METIPMKPEWERSDYDETVAALREGYASIEAGEARPAEEVFEEIRQKYGLART